MPPQSRSRSLRATTRPMCASPSHCRSRRDRLHRRHGKRSGPRPQPVREADFAASVRRRAPRKRAGLGCPSASEKAWSRRAQGRGFGDHARGSARASAIDDNRLTLIAKVDDRACAARLHPPVPACPLPEGPGRRRLPDRRAKQLVPRHTTTIAMSARWDEGMEAPSCPAFQGDKVAPNSFEVREAATSAASTASAAAMTRSSWPRAASNRNRPRAPGLKTN